jgi:hypothetical protein
VVCAGGDPSGARAAIPGSSFDAAVAEGGGFELSHVPAGTHALVVQVAGHTVRTLIGVSVTAGNATDAGSIATDADLATDPGHCGACGHACAAGAACVAGACQEP